MLLNSAPRHAFVLKIKRPSAPDNCRCVSILAWIYLTSLQIPLMFACVHVTSSNGNTKHYVANCFSKKMLLHFGAFEL
jgi:hypothetical protein